MLFMLVLIKGHEREPDALTTKAEWVHVISSSVTI
jgi:hypothetical protein